MNLVLAKRLAIPVSSILIGAPSSYGVYKYFSYAPGTNISVPLFKRSDFANKYSEGSYGRKFGNYFADASKESDWLFWSNKFNSRKVSRANSFLKSASSWEDLRNRCADFYLKESSDGQVLDKLDALVSCTTFSASPSSKSVNESDPNVMDFDTNHNDPYWEIRNKEFYEKDGYKLAAKNSSYTWFEGKKTTSQEKSIKDLCKEAYEIRSKTDIQTTTPPTKEEIEYYCQVT